MRVDEGEIHIIDDVQRVSYYYFERKKKYNNNF